MGLTAAMSNALSGLTANAWATDTIASNIANAQTPGYGPRDLQLASRLTGGVRVAGVDRAADTALLNDQRTATAGQAGADTTEAFFSALETLIGQPGDAGSLGAAVAGLGTALTQASAQPESDTALQGVVTAATTLAGKINAIGSKIQSARATADTEIGADVARLNTALGQVAQLNAAIQAQVINGGQPSALMDQRQSLIDSVSSIVPLRQLDRANDTVAVMTVGGTLLLDGATPAKIGFVTGNGVVTADMSLASGALSGLTVNGQPVSTAGPAFAGGRLAADFAIRDALAPAAQGQIDSLARDLADRFGSSAVDPTLGAGDPGLFTDAGTRASATNEPGLSQRLAVNALVDPSQGGALWHLRDGVNSLSAGPAGAGGIINAMGAALFALRVPASGALTSSATDATGLAADFLSATSTARLDAQTAQSYASAQVATYTDRALKQGVDTDQQMQQLLVVEKSYASNAKVIKAADSMLQSLLEI